MGWFCRVTARLPKNWFSLPVSARLKKRAVYPGTRIDSWLFTILHSIWISEVRARRVRLGQGFVESDELLAPETNEQDEARLHYGKIMQYVSALPEAQRNAVFLVYVEGFTYQEAADTLSVPIGTIMSRLATARAKIAQLIHTPHPVQEKRY
jgi:RNA polymerase sigma-70 factor (ECF subfamily)